MSNSDKAEQHISNDDLERAQVYATLAVADETRELKNKIMMLGATFLAIKMTEMTDDERAVVDLVIDGLIAKMEES